MDYPVSEEQILFYEENGYIQLHDVLTSQELADIRQAVEDVLYRQLDPVLDRVGANPEYDKVFIQKVNLWRFHEGIRHYVLNPKIARIALALSRSKRIRLWHDHVLVKMPGDSKPSAWHQDLPYWPMREQGALSCWMALDDVDEENGCMQFVPGSHRWGRFEPISLTNPQDLFALVPDPEGKDFTPTMMRMNAGSCTFHDGLMFHYAGPNRTERPRRAMITIYMPDGITYRDHSHRVTRDLGLKEGTPLMGEMFPVLAEK